MYEGKTNFGSGKGREGKAFSALNFQKEEEKRSRGIKPFLKAEADGRLDRLFSQG